MTTAIQKLLTERNVSPKFRAFAEYIANAPRTTTPSISSLSVTSDGYLISGHMFLGAAEDLRRNLQTICASYYPAIAKALRKRLGDADYWKQW